MKFSFINLGSPASRRQVSLNSVGRCSATLNSQPSTLNPLTPKRVRERGIALVITLILLSVITFMAVTFLVITRGERSTVSVITEQTTARLAADAALEAGKAELIAPMLAFSNASTVSLIVSTNYQSPGFTNGSASFLNVNYDHTSLGGPLTQAQALQNLANLCYLPRVPVFITNRLVANSNEFRFYLDLNRNGRYDTNGLVALQDKTGALIDPSGATVAQPYFVQMTGDPEWVGILERGGYTPSLMNGLSGSAFPRNYGHSSSNLFISRYCFIVVPSSRTLDVNNIHNYSKTPQLSPVMADASGDGFLRNMGAGSWEINLAAFLADLNTNLWSFPAPQGDFQYNANGSANNGTAFADAATLLRYRYNADPQNSLSSVNNLFGTPGNNAFVNDWVDGYSQGPVMTAFHWRGGSSDNDSISVLRQPWAGSDNTNHFFDTQDFFDRNKVAFRVTTPSNFVDRLTMAGNSTSTYDRYTFYRLLSQLGTDSDPEPPKMNLNYRNIDANGKIVPDMATNFLPWDPVQFFTNAAIRLLADAGYDTNVVYKGQIHIQIYPTNYYTPSVHRQLQVAANIYDATTNRLSEVYSNGFPSVFRPQFVQQVNSVGQKMFFINGYTEVTNRDIAISATSPVYLEPSDPRAGAALKAGNVMFYGVPMVVGAKKGYPNFNEFAMVNDLVVARRLFFYRTGPAAQIHTNQQYTLSVSNLFGIETWNSYTNPFPRELQMIVNSEILFSITNQLGGVILGNNGQPLITNFVANVTTNIAQNTWFGFQGAGSAVSFIVPQFTNYLFLSNSVYSFAQDRFLPFGFTGGDGSDSFPVPRWYLTLTNRLRFMLVDPNVPNLSGTPGRLIDYVNLSAVQEPVDITAQLMMDANGLPVDGSTFDGTLATLFDTNRIGRANNNPRAITYGEQNQIGISAGDPAVSDSFWNSWNFERTTRANATKGFSQWLAGQGTGANQTNVAAPFSPRRTIHQFVSWQVNDPLVHYMTADLHDGLSKMRNIQFDTAVSPDPFQDFAGMGAATKPLNKHYRPWKTQGADTEIPTNTKLELKDSLIAQSDNWDFPTNKFPNIGWLGRVHRGTPWQTVNLKAINLDTNLWALWSGHTITNWGPFTPILFDGANTHPTNDFRIMDLFTTAFNDNASRGQLSVNQSGLAAWSAVLSGVMVNTNGFDTNGLAIQPAGVYNPLLTNTWTPLVHIVDGINRTRSIGTALPAVAGLAFTNGVFNRLGDILYTPELTLASPFLNTNNAALLNDEAYERIPQQIMSLLRNDSAPRFVIYAFGQALKPAEHSIYLGTGPFFGMVTNYQITAESATRAVVHVEGAPAAPHVVVDSYNVLPPY